MEFEYDPGKSAANREKHGMDFVEAQELWGVVAAQKPLPHIEEARFLRIGLIGEKLWAAIFTMRGGRIRLISVRRARTGEVADYERAASREDGNDPQP